MMATTIISSIRVKPCCICFFMSFLQLLANFLLSSPLASICRYKCMDRANFFISDFFLFQPPNSLPFGLGSPFSNQHLETVRHGKPLTHLVTR